MHPATIESAGLVLPTQSGSWAPKSMMRISPSEAPGVAAENAQKRRRQSATVQVSIASPVCVQATPYGMCSPAPPSTLLRGSSRTRAPEARSQTALPPTAKRLSGEAAMALTKWLESV